MFVTGSANVTVACLFGSFIVILLAATQGTINPIPPHLSLALVTAAVIIYSQCHFTVAVSKFTATKLSLSSLL